MKTPLLYGLLAAIADALLVLALFFLGFHSDPAKLTVAKWVGGVLALAIAIVSMVAGIRARRSEVPEKDGFGYGSALGAGVIITATTNVIYGIFYFVYLKFINPGFIDVMLQDTMDKMAAKGITGAQADNVEKGVRFMLAPAVQFISQLIIGTIFGVILVLIIAAFLKRVPKEGTLQPPAL